MCGIAGIVGESNPAYLRKILSSFLYRGPDDMDDFIDNAGAVHLGMCRLSIIDLAGGHQPMSNEDDTIWVICNGEIYNAPLLRRQLLSKGHVFKTNNSDVEVLLHLYEEKGPELLPDLNGMFAFVIYDRARQVLFGARDRMGIKPFYYACGPGRFAFASELKGLLTLPWVSRQLDFQSLYHYLSLQYVPAPDSIFSDVKKLPAGYSFIYDLTSKSLLTRRYWQLPMGQGQDRSEGEWQALIREKLKTAIQRWTLSDVPIACSLSGGLDSSSIVGFLAQMGFKNLRTYSLGFAEAQAQDINELPLARRVAEQWGTEHHEVVLTVERVLQDLERMVWHLDEPYGGGLPSWYVYEMIGREVKVALTGTGGDELFGNYNKYHWLTRNPFLRFLKIFKNSWQIKDFDELRNGCQLPFGYFYPKYFSDAGKRGFLQTGQENFKRTEHVLEELAQEAQTTSPRNRVAYVDFQTQLPEEFLLVTDRFSMAHSVEARVPFLDHELVETVYQMPDRLRAMAGQPKGFLKNIVSDVIPASNLNSGKRGFILPLTLWTRNQIRPDVARLLGREHLKRQKVFSAVLFDEIVRPHLEGKQDYTQQVWTLFMFQKWYERFIGN